MVISAPRNYENWLQGYMRYSEHSEAPDKFHFWTGVSVVAGALRRRVWIDQGYFQWTPNFYILFVAPPGIVNKTTTMGIGMRLLRKLPYIHFGPEAVTWQALIGAITKATEMVAINDEFYPMSCLTIASGELGTLLDPKDREMVDLLTSLWDGQVGVWTKETKTQGNDEVENPWINLIGCTTPSWLAGHLPQYVAEGGFMSRCVIVYGDTKRGLKAYPMDHIPTDFKQQEERLLADLKRISSLKGAYHMTDSAKRFGRQWYERHYEENVAKFRSDALIGYLARKQTHLHKLAIVLAAAQRDHLVLEEEDLLAGAHILDSAEADMLRGLNYVGRSHSARSVGELVSLVGVRKRVTQAALYREVFGRMSYQEFRAALEGAVAGGLIKVSREGRDVFLGLGKPTDGG